MGNSQFSGPIFTHSLDVHLTSSTLIPTTLRAPEISLPQGSVSPGFDEVILHREHGQVVIPQWHLMGSGVNLKHLNAVSVKKSTP